MTGSTSETDGHNGPHQEDGVPNTPGTNYREISRATGEKASGQMIFSRSSGKATNLTACCDHSYWYNSRTPNGGAIPPSETHDLSQLAWERMVTAVEKVRDRLRRAAPALESASIPYAVAGGNAVAAWVSEVDEAAVRNTQAVDILLRREDLDRAKESLAKVGFIYRLAASIDMFLDGPNAKTRDAVHILFANEKVRKEYAQAAPDVDESKTTATARILSLDALLRMKLTSFLRDDCVDVRDLIEVGLVDTTWCQRLPEELAKRLQSLLDDPDG